MQKPTVFLSHSSRDGESLKRLQSALQRITSGTLSLFLSSDGQSIPFGRNWVATVEQALDSSALMFSFLSPFSTASAWINFEAGYAYARGVKVVPVAILGKDLNMLHPPLSLLQGFNLKSHEGLNNLLSVINATFSTTYPLTFTEEDYAELFTDRDRAVIQSFGKASTYVECVRMQFLGDEGMFERIKQEVIESHGDGFADESMVAVSGIEVRKLAVDQNLMIGVSVAPATFQLHVPLLRKFAGMAGFENGWIAVHLNRTYLANFEMWSLTGKFHGTPVKAVRNGFELDGVLFRLDIVGLEQSRFNEEGEPKWGVVFDPTSLERPQSIREVLELLIRLAVLQDEDIPF